MIKATDLKISALDVFNYNHCELFVTYVDGFYKEIKKYGLVDQLTPLPDSIMCVFQKAVNRMLGAEPEPGIKYTVTFTTVEKMSQLTLPLLITLGVTSLGILLYTQGTIKHNKIIGGSLIALGAVLGVDLLKSNYF